MKKRTNADLITQPKTGRKLTPKMKLFCQFYVTNGWNASKAVRDAGYSEKGCDVMAIHLLGNIRIQDLVKKVEQNIEQTCQISKSMLVLKQKEIAFDKRTEPAERQRAIQTLIDMLAYASPIKHDVNNTGTPSIVQLIRVDRIPSEVATSEQEIIDREGL